MNEWTILPSRLILDTNNMSKLIGKYVTIISKRLLVQGRWSNFIY